jgi:nitrogen fixation NifU-like protein
MNERMKQLYQELILDHNKNPRNFKVLDPADREALGHNPLCGDKLKLFLNINENGLISDIGFIGDGCAISKASASMMTTMVKGKTIEEAEELFHQFHDMSMGKLDIEKDPHKLGKLAIFAGVRDLPARVKCATLSWHTLHTALNNKEEISTE